LLRPFSKLHHHRIHHFLGGLAFWVAKIRQPRAAVELGIAGLDLACLVDHEDVNALDLLIVVARTVDGDPAPANLVAAVEDIQGREVERGLRARSGDEGCRAGESNGSFL
jgi:hypothetical protein